jgi:hypothetical protein
MDMESFSGGVHLVQVTHGASPSLGQKRPLMPPSVVAIIHVFEPVVKVGKSWIAFGAILHHATVRLEILIDVASEPGVSKKDQPA